MVCCCVRRAFRQHNLVQLLEVFDLGVGAATLGNLSDVLLVALNNCHQGHFQVSYSYKEGDEEREIAQVSL